MPCFANQHRFQSSMNQSSNSCGRSFDAHHDIHVFQSLKDLDLSVSHCWNQMLSENTSLQVVERMMGSSQGIWSQRLGSTAHSRAKMSFSNPSRCQVGSSMSIQVHSRTLHKVLHIKNTITADIFQSIADLRSSTPNGTQEMDLIHHSIMSFSCEMRAI